MNSPPPVEKVASLSDAARKLAVLARLRVGATVVARALVFFAMLLAIGAPHPFFAIIYLVAIAATVAAVVCAAAACQRAKATKLRAIFGVERVVISRHVPAPEQPQLAAAAAAVGLARTAAAVRRAATIQAAQLGCLSAMLAARLLPAPAAARA